MITTWNYSSSTIILNVGLITFNLTFTTESSSLPSRVISISGIISSSSPDINTDNLSLYPVNEGPQHENDNILNPTQPFFTSGGLSFLDVTHDISYNMALLSSPLDYVFQTFDTEGTVLENETLSISCIL